MLKAARRKPHEEAVVEVAMIVIMIIKWNTRRILKVKGRHVVVGDGTLGGCRLMNKMSEAVIMRKLINGGMRDKPIDDMTPENSDSDTSATEDLEEIDMNPIMLRQKLGHGFWRNFIERIRDSEVDTLHTTESFRK